MDVFSEIGVGTTFSLFLQPGEGMAELPTPHSPNTTKVNRKRNASITILVVEDERDVRELVHDMLQHDGYQVLVASDGVDALKIIGAQDAPSFDLVISDIVMPNMTGHELRRRLLELEVDVPFALMTGYDPNRTNASENDMTQLLRKPFNLEELRDLIHAILPE
jgi:CheY-like chemotaxis protein